MTGTASTCRSASRSLSDMTDARSSMSYSSWIMLNSAVASSGCVSRASNTFRRAWLQHAARRIRSLLRSSMLA
jgi:hypothetical protein